MIAEKQIKFKDYNLIDSNIITKYKIICFTKVISRI